MSVFSITTLPLQTGCINRRWSESFIYYLLKLLSTQVTLDTLRPYTRSSLTLSVKSLTVHPVFDRELAHQDRK